MLNVASVEQVCTYVHECVAFVCSRIWNGICNSKWSRRRRRTKEKKKFFLRYLSPTHFISMCVLYCSLFCLLNSCASVCVFISFCSYHPMHIPFFVRSTFWVWVCVGAASKFQCMFLHIRHVQNNLFFPSFSVYPFFSYSIVEYERWCSCVCMYSTREKKIRIATERYKTIEWSLQMLAQHLNTFQCLLMR